MCGAIKGQRNTRATSEHIGSFLHIIRSIAINFKSFCCIATYFKSKVLNKTMYNNNYYNNDNNNYNNK